MIVLDKHESFYLLLLKGWKDPNIVYTKDVNFFFSFRESITPLYKFPYEGLADEELAFMLISDLVVKCLSSHQLERMFREYNPYSIHIGFTPKLEDSMIYGLRFLSCKDLQFDYELCWNLVSYDDVTFKEFKTKE